MAINSVTKQVKAAGTGTYTPTSGMLHVLAILVGAGGNGASVTAADDAGGGGGGGGTAIKLFTAGDIGASKEYVVAAGGSGTTSRLGASGSELLTATAGGNGVATGLSTTVGVQAAGGAGGVGALGDLNILGEPGMRAVIYSTTHGCGGSGGTTAFGAGGAQSGTEAAGNPGGAYGGGGGGAHCAGDTNRSGGTGADGVLFLLEFIGT